MISAPAAEPAAAVALPPELQAELDALQRQAWFPSGAVRASLGWKDNVLLSPYVPIERAFGRAEVDAILLRPMRDDWEFVSFLNGDILRYASPPQETDGEQQWLLHTEGRWQPVARARLSLKAAVYYSDTVIDLSETESSRLVAPTTMQGGYVESGARVTLPGSFALEPAVQRKRTDFREYAGDYDETRAGGRLSWSRTPRLAVTLGWFEVRRDYLAREQFSAGGRPLAGTRLEFRQREAEAKVSTRWTAGGDWTLAGAVGQLENRDGASGYFDFDQQRARLELEWATERWRVLLDGEASRHDYLAQTVGTGVAPPPRIADDFEVSLRTERALNGPWSAFAEYRWERSRSNEREFSYRANSVLAGVQREF